jgi:hypothetical protein
MSNVYSIVAAATGYTNLNLTGAQIPLSNATGTIPGPLNPNMYVPFLAPNTAAVGAGGGPVFVAPGVNTNLTAANAPAPVNLTALGELVPAAGALSSSSATGTAAGPGSTSSSSAMRREVVMGGLGVAVFGALIGNAGLFV